MLRASWPLAGVPFAIEMDLASAAFHRSMIGSGIAMVLSSIRIGSKGRKAESSVCQSQTDM